LNIAGQYERVRRVRARKEGSRERGEKRERNKRERKKEVMTGRKVEMVKGSVER